MFEKPHVARDMVTGTARNILLMEAGVVEMKEDAEHGANNIGEKQNLQTRESTRGPRSASLGESQTS